MENRLTASQSLIVNQLQEIKHTENEVTAKICVFHSVLENKDSPEKMLKLQCLHRICNSCVKKYVTQQYKAAKEEAVFECVRCHREMNTQNVPTSKFIS